MSKLLAQIGSAHYSIEINTGILSSYRYFKPYIHGKQVAIITNQSVADLYLSTLKQTLTPYHQVNSYILPDGEQTKNLINFELIISWLFEKKYDHGCTIIALGGGVTGDIAGFVAACYLRGVKFIQCPTTLLAQIDSAIGGKTGVNHQQGKNMIGVIRQPHAVLVDMSTLDTLPQREFCAGLAEMIKYGLICDKQFYYWLHQNIDHLLNKNTRLLSQAIYQSCQYKIRIVASDPEGNDVRMLLNFGHTFGHAIEQLTDYTTWLHGEAVAIGMVMAARLSFILKNNITVQDINGLIRLLQRAHLPVTLSAAFDIKQWTAHFAHDKKIKNGVMHFILLQKIGQAKVGTLIDPRILHYLLQEEIVT